MEITNISTLPKTYSISKPYFAVILLSFDICHSDIPDLRKPLKNRFFIILQQATRMAQVKQLVIRIIWI
jgi:hypothetical protein